MIDIPSRNCFFGKTNDLSFKFLLGSDADQIPLGLL